MLKTQIIVVAESFDLACAALSALVGDTEGRLKEQLESSCAVSIDEDHKVWLQQVGNPEIVE